MISVNFLFIVLAMNTCLHVSFILTYPKSTSLFHTLHSSTTKDSDVTDNINIFFKGITSGDGFKQSLADAFAGSDFDFEDSKKKIEELSTSAPCVIFSWTMSPFSKKAKKFLSDINCETKVIELDRPWEEGNKLRAALGRIVGRTSVPCVFIGK